MNMKKLLIICSVIFLTTLSVGQNVNLTATVQDPTGQVFQYGTYSISFVRNPSSNVAAANYAICGTAQKVHLGPFTGALDINGTFALTMINARNDQLCPSGSKWQITVCPDAGAGGGGPQCTVVTVPLTSASVNLSTQLNTATNIISVFGLQPMATAYKDSEVSATRDGTFYFRTSDGVVRTYYQGVWSTISGGGGSGTVTQVSPATDVGDITNFGAFGFSNQTTTPILTINLVDAPGYTVWGNCTGAGAKPNYCLLVGAMIPDNAANTTGNADTATLAATATAAASAGTECSAGQAARGVDASWNAIDCFVPASTSVINSGSGYALPIYASGAGTTLSPSNITSDATKNNLNVPGGIGTGTQPTSCDLTTGCHAMLESAGAGSPTVGEDYIRADSTLHKILYSENNSAESALATPLYIGDGTKQLSPHIVHDTCAIGSTCAPFTLGADAVFTNSTSYTCTAQDTTAAAATKIVQASGSQFTITGTGTDTVRFVCVGN